jgi:hypothetical protein
LVNRGFPAAAARPKSAGASRAAYGDLQDLPCGQVEFAADLGASTTNSIFAVSSQLFVCWRSLIA